MTLILVFLYLYSLYSLLNLFSSANCSVCFIVAFPPSRNSYHVVSVSVDFPSNSKGMALFIAQIMVILVLGRIYLNLALLQLLLCFVNGFRLKLMYISPIINIRSRPIHLHCFQLPLVLPQVKVITSFICNNKIREFLKMSNLVMLMKQDR